MDKTVRPSKRGIFFFLAILSVILLNDLFAKPKVVELIPYSQFLSYLNDSNVVSVSLTDHRIEGTIKTPSAGHSSHFSTVKVEDPTLTDKMMKSGVRFEANDSGFFASLISWLTPLLVMLFFWWFIFGRMQRSQ